MTIKIWQTRTDKPEIARRWRWKRIDAETGKTIYQSVRNYATREEAAAVVEAAREEMAEESFLVKHRLQPKIASLEEDYLRVVLDKQSMAGKVEKLLGALAQQREKSATLLTAFTEEERARKEVSSYQG